MAHFEICLISVPQALRHGTWLETVTCGNYCANHNSHVSRMHVMCLFAKIYGCESCSVGAWRIFVVGTTKVRGADSSPGDQELLLTYSFKFWDLILHFFLVQRCRSLSSICSFYTIYKTFGNSFSFKVLVYYLKLVVLFYVFDNVNVITLCLMWHLLNYWSHSCFSNTKTQILWI